MKKKVRVYKSGGTAPYSYGGTALPNIAMGGQPPMTQDSALKDNVPEQKTSSFVKFLKTSTQEGIVNEQIKQQKAAMKEQEKMFKAMAQDPSMYPMAQDGYSMQPEKEPAHLVGRNSRPGATSNWKDQYYKGIESKTNLNAWMGKFENDRSTRAQPLNAAYNIGMNILQQPDVYKQEGKRQFFNGEEDVTLDEFNVTGYSKVNRKGEESKFGRHRSLDYNVTGNKAFYPTPEEDFTQPEGYQKPLGFNQRAGFRQAGGEPDFRAQPFGAPDSEEFWPNIENAEQSGPYNTDRLTEMAGFTPRNEAPYQVPGSPLNAAIQTQGLTLSDNPTEDEAIQHMNDKRYMNPLEDSDATDRQLYDYGEDIDFARKVGNDKTKRYGSYRGEAQKLFNANNELDQRQDGGIPKAQPGLSVAPDYGIDNTVSGTPLYSTERGFDGMGMQEFGFGHDSKTGAYTPEDYSKLQKYFQVNQEGQDVHTTSFSANSDPELFNKFVNDETEIATEIAEAQASKDGMAFGGQYMQAAGEVNNQTAQANGVSLPTWNVAAYQNPTADALSYFDQSFQEPTEGAMEEDGNIFLKKQSKLKAANEKNPYLGSHEAIVAGQIGTNFFNQDDTKDMENEIRRKMSDVHENVATTGSDRGDYVQNSGYLKPDQHTLKGRDTKIGQEGGQIGDEMDLTDLELERMTRDGYVFDFID